MTYNIIKVIVDKNSRYNKNTCANQEHKIFLISINEFEKYLKTDEEECMNC